MLSASLFALATWALGNAWVAWCYGDATLGVYVIRRFVQHRPPKRDRLSEWAERSTRG